ncbi:ATP-binding protein [Leptospira stimsonii]|uniref:histidine kinase n=1 Tax=Leptospira stimsonii TaxID=2202203 RepID=A0A396YWF3_9LEPT|nr:ATP-binding protein [Leptospira stimsonii]RHX85768.1 hybrid sensor histidine kinase/response regulator [Leptospira stimsonii]
MSDRFSDEIPIFLVEDDEEDAILFREYLNDIPFPKYILTRYKDAHAALDALRSRGRLENEIYVIDQFLGAQTGLALLNDIQTIVGNVSAILVSGLSKEEIETAAKESGFAGFLEKKYLSASSLSKEFLRIQFGGSSKVSSAEKLSEEELRVLRMDTIAQFGGGIAHDFNNILNIIIANLDLLEMQSKEQPDVLNRIRSAQNAVMRAADVNKKLLNFSRKQSLHQELTNPNDLISDFLKNQSETIPKNVRVLFESEGREDRCLLDHSEFVICLTQLLQNAVEALETKEGEILVETIRVVSDPGNRISGLENGNYFLLKITDTGIGIREENVEKIFEPFYTTKPKGKSSGLGLPMVYGFVKRSKGRIFFQSELKVGTEFYLYLPIIELESDPTFKDQNSKIRSQEIIYFCKDGPFADWIVYSLKSLGFVTHKVIDFENFNSNFRNLERATCYLSETWQTRFSEWRDFAVKAKRTNSKIEINYFSGSEGSDEFENSFAIRWPISRKSLENHFDRM